MRRRAESLLPWAVLVGFLVAALMVNLLLTSAQRRGVVGARVRAQGERGVGDP